MVNFRTKMLIIPGIAVFALLLVFFASRLVPSPPVKDMENARDAVSMARKNRADIYSEKLFTEAKVYYDSAMIYWRKENRRFIYSRDYKKISEYADLSADKARQAFENSQINAENLKSALNQKIKTLNDLVSDLARRFNDYPLTAEIRNYISKGKFLLKESEIAFQESQYMTAEEKITESEYLLTTSYESANENLKSYFRSFPEWKRWVDSTIAESKETRDYSIIVDKYSRKVIVYLNGDKQCEYSAELGKNWVGDKRVRGDKATPEGMYKIVRKFESDSTKYYKALLLDYPNDEDTAIFEASIAKGILPKSAKIGGMIEIHGDGGKGADWTEGCIALTNREMDMIFNIAKVGTPVTIVGSMRDLRHILNR
jgi:murein L,D-transpeptidase YafK